MTAVAFLKRDWLIARSYRLPFLMNVAGSAIVLVVLFQIGKLVNTADAQSGLDLAHGYFSFAVLGTLVLQTVHSATQTFASKMREEETTGTLEALLAAPTSPAKVILGSGVYNMVQSIVLALVIILLALPLGLRIVVEPTWLCLSLVSFVALIALAGELGILIASFTVVFKQGSTLSGLVGAAIALLGGVWYPVNSLPPAARALARLIPFTWGLTSLRDELLFGRLQAAQFAGVVVSAIVILPLCLVIFRFSVDRARVRGTLAQY